MEVVCSWHWGPWPRVLLIYHLHDTPGSWKHTLETLFLIVRDKISSSDNGFLYNYYALVVYFFFFFLRSSWFYFYFRERESVSWRGIGEANVTLDLMALRWHPELKPSVWCLTSCTSQVPLYLYNDVLYFLFSNWSYFWEIL